MIRTLLMLICISISSTLFAVEAQHSSAEYNKPYQEQALNIYRDTIAMETSLGQHMVPTMAHYLGDRFRDGGFDDEDINVILFQPPGGEETASLVVRYRGDGHSGKKPILFVAHMDVVGALREDWVRDPFTLIEEDGYFFGRGTDDDKAGTTLLTAAFLRLKSEGFVPTRDLIVAFSGDEETAMATIKDLVESHRDLIDAEFAINADAGGGSLDSNFKPIAYRLQAAEKAYVDFELIVRNPGGHSSRPQADNAIYRLGDALKKIQEYQFPVRYNDITRQYFKLRSAAESGEVAEAMLAFSRNPADKTAAATLATYPSHVGVIRTTCVATMLNAGHAENALPQSAKANINCRIFPGITVTEVHQVLKDIIDDDEVEVAMLGEPESAPASALREDVVDAISKGVHSIYPGLPIIPSMSTGATDGRTLRANGIPTYGSIAIFGRSEDNFAHGLNERVPVKSFFDALEHWHVVIKELAGR